ncbi:MAG: protoglobin domain-containing protein [bacterium]
MQPDSTESHEKIGPTWAVLHEFLAFSDSDDALLRAAGAEVSLDEKHAFVEEFYSHLLAHAELRAILTVPNRIERLKSSLVRYVESLLTTPIDDAYLAERRRIGLAHVKIGLLPRWYLGGYSHFLSWWLPRISKGAGGSARARAFLRRLLLDQILAMESYVATRVEGLEQETKSLDMEVREKGRRLAESERQYEELVETAPEMIYQLDAENRFVGVNQTGLGRLGYTTDEMRDLNLWQVVPPAYRRGVEEHLGRVVSQGSARLETVFRAKAGEEFPVELYTTAQYETDGALIRTRSFVRDLSERTRLERELLKWERLAAVGSMAAKVAHEIRNPLLAISLNAELVGDELAALPTARRKEGERLLSTILSEVDRLNAIIEEYLAFARLPRLAIEKSSLQEIFYRLEQLLTPEMSRRGIQLRIVIDEDLRAVSGDSRQLEQVFLNLLRNAEDAMPEGGEIRVHARDEARGVEVTITDNGVGIPEESVTKIFDPFFTTKDTGTGLGLAYVQQVLFEHHGRIHCQSRVGHGTEFVMFLPYEPGRAVLPR